MPTEFRVVSPGPRPGTVRTEQGVILSVPAHWVHVPPGDAALTRRVKLLGPCWTMHEKRGRKTFSLGLYAAADHVEQVREALRQERDTPSYAKKLASGRARRAAEQTVYEGEFLGAVLAFLAFSERYAALAARLAHAITAHAVPVGSGTVARTERIPVEQRAEAATIAWLRHATTTYDDMVIPRVKGMRREVRRELATRSRTLLDRYRRGESVDVGRCAITRGLDKSAARMQHESV